MQTPYYEDDSVKLYLGNSMDLLVDFEDNTFDAIITDPPYCSGGLHASARTKGTANKYLNCKNNVNLPDFDGDSKDQRAFHFWCTLWLTECNRLTKQGGILAQFTDWRQLPITTDVIQAADWTWRGVSVWNKGNGRPRRGGMRNQCEYIVWGSKGNMLNQGEYLAGCFNQSIVNNKKRVHQTQKPVEVMTELCRLAPGKNSLILDPFAGSGSTLAAAKATGKKAIGIERSEFYAEKIAERLQNMNKKVFA